MTYNITLNNKTYQVEVERGEAILVDEFAAVAPQAVAPVAAAVPQVASAPAAASAAHVAGEVVASPLPGVVLSVNVAAGKPVKKGDVLLLIEAMKMENEIFAPRDGTVAQVVAAKGAQVATGDPLVVLS